MVYHPVVQEYEQMQEQFDRVMQAILASSVQVLCLEPNSDAGGQLIRAALNQYRQRFDVIVLKHLERSEFINCLANCDVMMGNSSSGYH